MQKQAEYHKLVPKDPVLNVKFRIEVLQRCASDPEFRVGIREMCARDIIFFIDVFGWQFNPKLKGYEADAPFVCWDFQEAALLDRPETTGRPGILWCYEKNRTCVVEKSRDMGISWLFLFLQDWLCIFGYNVQCLDISRGEKQVDHKSPDSLFWKIREIHAALPEFITGEILQQELYFGFEGRRSYITGEASTGKAGVGGRASVIFIDEFSQIREDKAVRARTASTSDCRFFNGTHVGVGSEFYKLTQTPEIAKIQMHWSRHPKKKPGLYKFNQARNKVEYLDPDYVYPPDYQFVTDGRPFGGPHPGLRSPWYDVKVLEIGDERSVAEDLDMNPSGSVSQFYQAKVINDMVLEYARPPCWQGDVVKVDGKYELYEAGHNEEGPLKDGSWPLKLWIQPDHYGNVMEAIYKFGCDLSWGYGATNSCISILNAETGERVGEYVRPDMYPEVLAPIVVWLAKLFHEIGGQTAELIWETQGPGTRFGKEVIELAYLRIYWNQNELAPFAKKKRREPGWFPEPKAKYQLHDAYRSALRNKDFLNHCEIALEECLLFQQSDDGSRVFHTGSLTCDDPSGAGVNHGDRTTSDALAWKLAAGHAKRAREEQKKDTEAPLLSLAWRRQYRKDQERRVGRRA